MKKTKNKKKSNRSGAKNISGANKCTIYGKKNIGEVAIYHMYSGNYLKNGNLGHEIINLFKGDNGNHYIYAMSAGDYDTKKHKGLIKKVILVRNVDRHKAEILGICDVEEDIFGSQVNEPHKYKMLPSVEELKKRDFMNHSKPKGTKKDKKVIQRIEEHKNVHEQQIEYIDKNNITYGEVKLNKLFSNNDTEISGYSIYVTFRVKRFRKPKEVMYLCDKSNNNKDPHYYNLKSLTRMCGQSITKYVSINDKEIQRLINGHYWEKNDNSSKVDIKKINKKSISILNIIKSNNNELTYSNWIAYYLKNDIGILKSFIKKFAKVSTSFKNIEIARETKNNIDIYYEDSNSIFVFENKIKASISGTNVKNGISVDKKEISQLKKYYDYAEKKAKETKPKKNTRYFIFLPDYVYKDTTKLKRYEESDKYIIIRYSQLLAFFKSCETELPYYDDFIKAIEYHSSEYCNDLYSEMLERLQSIIKLR